MLVLGGTGPARLIASVVALQGFRVIYSLAGVTTRPALPDVTVRIGGFGGPEGLLSYIREEGIDVLIDATHPHAVRISASGFAAASDAGISHVLYRRPVWDEPVASGWLRYPDAASAAQELPAEACVYLTIGRKGIAPFVERHDLHGEIRMIEPPDIELPTRWSLRLARPPFTLADEIEALRRSRATHLVTKDSGGSEGQTKLAAARQLGVCVVMITRPDKQGGIVVHELSTFENLGLLIQSQGRQLR